MKLYTTSQAIRILERYPDREYVFEAPHSDYWTKARLLNDKARVFHQCWPVNSWVDCEVIMRSDWRLVRPKRKRGRSVAVGKIEDGCIKIDSDGQHALLSGDWTLIAVEKTDG